MLLEWDGEEGFGYAEVWKHNGWKMLPTKVLESRELEFQAAIQMLCTDLQGYVIGMAYTLQAVIARSGAFSGPLPQGLEVIRLIGGMDMLPLSTEALKAHDIPFCPLTDEGEKELPPQLLKLCKQLSKQCTLAYVEAEFFGGAGAEARALFSDGKAIGQAVVSEGAINEALRYLGVAKGDAHDEFEAVGLAQHRDTDEWLA